MAILFFIGNIFVPLCEYNNIKVKVTDYVKTIATFQ